MVYGSAFELTREGQVQEVSEYQLEPPFTDSLLIRFGKHVIREMIQELWHRIYPFPARWTSGHYHTLVTFGHSRRILFVVSR